MSAQAEVNANSIDRGIPDIGYVDKEVFEDIGIVQTAVAGDTVYVSGIAPLTGGAELSLVATTFEDQLRFVLEVLDRSLQSVGANRCDLVAWTVYTTDMAALTACAPLLKDWVGVHPPTSTWVTVSGFIHPEQQLELTAIAVR
ncbi:RidA family protein [Mycolicibacterium austroafricanum]|uniref:RidA family protein n=1 Tax=Mycolicibacterium austroafricanum TaxID=39687 RepID=UPI000684C390|nr:RidA family protein [Mycolicibacterium austroafricanum]QZY45761.1 RidA family protein [Mycolicibacterium austroafricanum]